MGRPKSAEEPRAMNSFRFNLIGLVVFSLFLVAAGSFVTAKVLSGRPTRRPSAESEPPPAEGQAKGVVVRQGPWGELQEQNIKLERPAELMTAELTHPEGEKWVFRGMNLAQVKELFLAGGLTGEQVEKGLTADRIQAQEGGIVFRPGEDFILSLSPETHTKLCKALYGKAINTYLDYPYFFPDGTIESIYGDERLQPEDVALLKRLAHRNGDATRLSDYEMLIQGIPTVQRRKAMSQVLSRQPAVLAALVIRPDTDIDKVAGYWGNVDYVRFDDMRPLLQALRELPNGGQVSLVYFLPPFARERLYTFPVPERDDPIMDCHWTTFNFENEKPDKRFNDPAYSLEYLKEHYYQIAEANIFGDIVMMANEKSDFQHSAVYLADDLVFTKYGNNYTQPWMIVRMSDMQAEYPALKPVYFRKKID